MPRERLVFQEEFGELTAEQLRVYRQHNISPADHDQLVYCFGDRPDAIVAFVLTHPQNTAYHLMQLARR